jgi:hypothetical protein
MEDEAEQPRDPQESRAGMWQKLEVRRVEKILCPPFHLSANSHPTLSSY